jgi:hypothetical protein
VAAVHDAGFRGQRETPRTPDLQGLGALPVREGGFIGAGLGISPAPALPLPLPLPLGRLPTASSPVTVPAWPISARRSTGRDGLGPRRRCTRFVVMPRTVRPTPDTQAIKQGTQTRATAKGPSR